MVVDLGLTPRQEDDVVAFAATLSDGYTAPDPDPDPVTP
jgi:hypothetical protein